MFKNYISIFVIVCCLTACSGKKSNGLGEVQKTATKEDLILANRVLVKKDQKRIEGVVSRNNWNMHETETGLWYEIIEFGNGVPAKEGMLITISYSISLLDGTLCYSSDIIGDKTFQIGRGGVEAGLEQGILLCTEGTKARFILPPYLAYGLPGDGDKIPARSIIVYELEVLKISTINAAKNN